MKRTIVLLCMMLTCCTVAFSNGTPEGLLLRFSENQHSNNAMSRSKQTVGDTVCLPCTPVAPGLVDAHTGIQPAE